MPDFDQSVKLQLTTLINGGEAHVTFEQAIHDLPFQIRGVKPTGFPYSIWQLADHIRITQWDILKFSTNPRHLSPKWPDEYWSDRIEPADDDQWYACLNQISSDKAQFIELITNSETDLFKPIDGEKGPNLFREALLIADHTAYHTGQIILMRRFLKAWDE